MHIMLSKFVDFIVNKNFPIKDAKSSWQDIARENVQLSFNCILFISASTYKSVPRNSSYCNYSFTTVLSDWIISASYSISELFKNVSLYTSI